jgi:hypothetical protein
VNGDEVWAVRFNAGAFEAYEAREVDDLLCRVAAELDAGRPTGPLIESARFWRRRENFRTRATQGYDVEAVDWFLSQLLLLADCSRLPGIGGDPWRDLGDVAQLTRSGADGADRHRGVQAWLASDKHFAGECANAWRDFGQEPGTRLLYGRARGGHELCAADGETIAFRGGQLRVQTVSTGGRSFTFKKIRPARSTPPGFAEILARSERDFDGHFAKNRHSWMLLNDPLIAPRRNVRELADEAGTPILYTSGQNFGSRAWTRISFPDQRWLRFLVRGTQKGNAIMTAVDQAGNRAVRYRIINSRYFAGDTVEITVRPDWKLTDELALAIAISAPWLPGYFQTGGGGLSGFCGQRRGAERAEAWTMFRPSTQQTVLTATMTSAASAADTRQHPAALGSDHPNRQGRPRTRSA